MLDEDRGVERHIRLRAKYAGDMHVLQQREEKDIRLQSSLSVSRKRRKRIITDQ